MPAKATGTAWLAAGVTVLFWSSGFIGIRAAGQQLAPGPLALARLVVASLVLGAILLGRRQPLLRRRDLPAVIACGVLWFGIYNLALNAAERRIDAGTAAMIIGLGPIMVAVIAGTVLRERFPRGLIVGTAVSFAGVVVIGLATAGTGGRDVTGVLLCLLAAAAYAGAVAIQKPLLARASALPVTWLCCLVGTVCCLPFGPELVHDLGTARPAAIGWAVYLGALPTAVAFTTWAYALARTSAGRLGATIYVVPVFSLGLGWLVLAEVPPPAALLGGALCLAGVAVSRWKGQIPGWRRNGIGKAPAPGNVRERPGAGVETRPHPQL